MSPDDRGEGTPYEEAIGHISLAAYVRTVAGVVAESPDFGLLLAAGDSGQLAIAITLEVYRALERTPPKIFLAPLHRHSDPKRTRLFDNTVLAPQFELWRGAQFDDVLFVDDEIWHGVTFDGILDLLMTLEVRISRCTIIAENGGYCCPPDPSGVSLSFVEVKKREPTVYNAISHAIPKHLGGPIRAGLERVETLNDKQAMCTLLGLPVRRLSGGVPFFSRNLIEVAAQRVPRFHDLQAEFRAWFSEIINSHLRTRE